MLQKNVFLDMQKKSTSDERTFIFNNHKNDSTSPAKESIKTNVLTPIP